MKFEVVSKYKDASIQLPTLATTGAAGHDFCVAEDIIIPPYAYHMTNIMDRLREIHRIPTTYTAVEDFVLNHPFDLAEMEKMTKSLRARPTLVPTGIKCQIDEGKYLELSMRSSSPLKYWLVLANGVGVIDADYYNNPNNEGEIFFQVINLSPVAIKLKAGDKIGQGILKSYYKTEDDKPTAERTGGFGSTSK